MTGIAILQSQYDPLVREINNWKGCKCRGVKHTCKDADHKNSVIEQSQLLANQINNHPEFHAFFFPKSI